MFPRNTSKLWSLVAYCEHVLRICILRMYIYNKLSICNAVRAVESSEFGLFDQNNDPAMLQQLKYQYPRRNVWWKLLAGATSCQSMVLNISAQTGMWSGNHCVTRTWNLIKHFPRSKTDRTGIQIEQSGQLSTNTLSDFTRSISTSTTNSCVYIGSSL